jgi:hypothetical protein
MQRHFLLSCHFENLDDADDEFQQVLGLPSHDRAISNPQPSVPGRLNRRSTLIDQVDELPMVPAEHDDPDNAPLAVDSSCLTTSAVGRYSNASSTPTCPVISFSRKVDTSLSWELCSGKSLYCMSARATILHRRSAMH